MWLIRREASDEYAPLDMRRKVIARGAWQAAIGACGLGAFALIALNDLDEWHPAVWITWVFVSSMCLLFGLASAIEGAVHYHRYRKLLDSRRRDPWDQKEHPTEYGPWRPGDP